jgi:hypothetical protein
LSASVPETLPRHLQITDFDVSLERGSTGQLQPVVQGLRVHVTPDGLQALALGLVAEADRRAPATLWLEDVRVGPAGIDLVVRVEKSFFRSDLAIRLVFSAPGGEVLRIEVIEVDVPAWMPLDLLHDEASKRGGAAVRRDPANRRALLLDPAALLTRFGVPGRFAPGRWEVATGADGIVLAFREGDSPLQ